VLGFRLHWICVVVPLTSRRSVGLQLGREGWKTLATLREVGCRLDWWSKQAACDLLKRVLDSLITLVSTETSRRHKRLQMRKTVSEKPTNTENVTPFLIMAVFKAQVKAHLESSARALKNDPFELGNWELNSRKRHQLWRAVTFLKCRRIDRAGLFFISSLNLIFARLSWWQNQNTLVIQAITQSKRSFSNRNDKFFF